MITSDLPFFVVEKDKLAVRSYPVQIFIGRTVRVTPTSKLLLYCQANSVSESLVMTWMKDGKPLTTHSPSLHYREHKSEKISTLMLWADPPTSGVYQCIARDSSVTARGISQHILGAHSLMHS